MGNIKSAITNYEKALKLKPEYPEVYNNQATIMKDLGNFKSALESYKKAVALNPSYAEAYANMGVCYQDKGIKDEALKSYNKALKINPKYAEIHRYISSLTKYSHETRHMLEMKSILEEKAISLEDRCHLHFALAKAYEDCERIDESFQHYIKGNSIRKKVLNYEISEDEKLFKLIRKSQKKICENTFNGETAKTTPKPIFILGMPRSGTTLVEQIISSHHDVHGAGELSYIENLGLPILRNHENLRRNIIASFRKKYIDKIKVLSSSKDYVTDKMPHNFRFVALITAAFPEAKIIHVKRSPIATCWSNFKTYFEGLSYSYDLKDIAQFYFMYFELMEFWSEKYPKNIYICDYEKLTENQYRETKKLISHLNLTWDEQCLSPHKNMRTVKTASQQQVREKIYSGSSNKWKKYKHLLTTELAETQLRKWLV